MKQNYELKNEKIEKKFQELLDSRMIDTTERLTFSWSNWGFGFESLEDSFDRLYQAGIEYIEIHGNHYGKDLGYSKKETKKLMEKYNMGVSGVCGMYSADNDLSSNNPRKR
ncbi:hypothetical protein [Salibacterium halotolerans]|uniref:Xylose isomerase-like TIM barrel n=1 Tax=Salibacterium halotolerans TaxID=1884432 RepID=A0A1I5TM82_9BACI|nr:hypothetical protein [Salibacterium halotolerans]SFP84182.1 hypothetical protein SAMN05518683_11114 [Salibacterium halotolerans]